MKTKINQSNKLRIYMLCLRIEAEKQLKKLKQSNLFETLNMNLKMRIWNLK